MNTNYVPIPRDILEAPFPPELIKSRPGSYGNSLSYIEGHTVIGRLNEAFEGNWSFEIVSHQILEEEVLVLAKFRAEAGGVVKMSWGSSKITRNDRTGQQVFEAAKPPKSFYVIPGADHNNTYQVGGTAYFRRWAEFVQAALQS